MRYIVALIWLLASATQAGAHDQGAGSWIGKKSLSDPGGRGHCCNHQDCQEIPAGGISERDGGFHITETGEIIPYSRVLWESLDGKWWRCRFLQDVSDGGRAGWTMPGSKVKYKKNDTRCLIGPPQSF